MVGLTLLAPVLFMSHNITEQVGTARGALANVVAGLSHTPAVMCGRAEGCVVVIYNRTLVPTTTFNERCHFNHIDVGRVGRQSIRRAPLVRARPADECSDADELDRRRASRRRPAGAARPATQPPAGGRPCD